MRYYVVHEGETDRLEADMLVRDLSSTVIRENDGMNDAIELCVLTFPEFEFMGPFDVMVSLFFRSSAHFRYPEPLTPCFPDR